MYSKSDVKYIVFRFEQSLAFTNCPLLTEMCGYTPQKDFFLEYEILCQRTKKPQHSKTTTLFTFLFLPLFPLN